MICLIEGFRHLIYGLTDSVSSDKAPSKMGWSTIVIREYQWGSSRDFSPEVSWSQEVFCSLSKSW
jgi:hypothetical protein